MKSGDLGAPNIPDSAKLHPDYAGFTGEKVWAGDISLPRSVVIRGFRVIRTYRDGILLNAITLDTADHYTKRGFSSEAEKTCATETGRQCSRFADQAQGKKRDALSTASL